MGIHRHRNNLFSDTADKKSTKNILQCVLAVTALKRLKLTWYQPIYNDDGFVFESDSLEELVLEGKHFPLENLRLPLTKTFPLDDMWFPMYNNTNKQELVQKVLDGCPKLELFNDIDVEANG